eukprot:scaffold75862_cov39-Prasinocladus_malaysianus.AAC.1
MYSTAKSFSAVVGLPCWPAAFCRLEIRETLIKGQPDAEAARRAADLIEQLEDKLLDVHAENRSLHEEVRLDYAGTF